MITGKRVLVGVTGGIAAYKSAELVRLLTGKGASVRVVMTDSATKFITPLTLQALSQNPVRIELTDPEAEEGMDHISLARWADLVIIAPATANTLAALAHGFAANLLETLCLATTATVMIAPAMNQQMWAHPATQANIERIQRFNIPIIGPAHGEQACGEIGPGRMVEPVEIASEIERHFAAKEQQRLTGLNLVITAGPTQEAIDPVRYLSNHSSGRMGFALAEASQQMGATVTLISGPVELDTPAGVNRIDVISAKEMYQATKRACENADIFIAAAAVADYTPNEVSKEKVKKSEPVLNITLSKTVDILKSISTEQERSKPLFTVGFAAETNNLLEHAKQKLINKKLNMVIANDVSQTDIGFRSKDNQITILTPDNPPHTVQKAPKLDIAMQIIDKIARSIDHSKT